MLEYTSSIVHDALLYSEHASRTNIVLNDVQLAVLNSSKKFQNRMPNRAV